MEQLIANKMRVLERILDLRLIREMTKPVRVSLPIVGVLLFALGLLLGQQTQRSKFDKYLRPGGVTAMDLAVLRANVGALKSYASIEVPVIYYEPSCACFLAKATVTSAMMTESLDQVRAKLLTTAYIARRAIAFEFPELSTHDGKPGEPFQDLDFRMTFFEVNIQNPSASHYVADYVNGKIVFR
jgi:hypothetical protein